MADNIQSQFDEPLPKYPMQHPAWANNEATGPTDAGTPAEEAVNDSEDIEEFDGENTEDKTLKPSSAKIDPEDGSSGRRKVGNLGRRS